jgi:hypothetical protein
MTEMYEKLQVLLPKKIGYVQHRWNIRADLNVLTVLTGLQEKTLHFADFYANGTAERRTNSTEQKWPLHSETTAGQNNVAYTILVDKSKTYVTPLHIKHCLIKV